MQQLQQLYRCGLGEHWRRQIGDVHPSAFARNIGGCEDLIHRLTLFATLDGHDGCVNTVSFNPTGELLVSGSDDREIVIWNWAAKEQILSYHSGHEGNVFQARVMPFSDDRTIVSCAADGQVRYGQILEDGRVETKMLDKHKRRAHKLAIEPGSARTFFSCGEDGVVRQFDLREEKSTKLFVCHHSRAGKPGRQNIVHLNAIVINPINANYFSVGGSDEYARVYDIRRVTVSGSDNADQPVAYFAPKHLIGTGQVRNRIHITCVAYSQQEELLVSYNDELIYLFDNSMGLGSNAQNRQETGGKADGDGIGPEPDTLAQVYKGHRNADTVKGVNFFGPNMEYVISGSDCGRIYIWKKKGGELVALMKGDNQVVNCLEPHPHATILATSGIDDTIKIWTPTADHLLPLPQDAELDVVFDFVDGYAPSRQVMEMNKRRREAHAQVSTTRRHVFRFRQLQSQSDNESGFTRVSFEDRIEDDDEDGIMGSECDGDNSSEDGDPGSPRECIIS